LVDESDLQCFLSADVLAGEDHVKRVAHADETRQSLGAAAAGNDAELHLGEREDRLGMIGADAIRTGERELESRAETRTVNRRHDRRGRLLDEIEDAMRVAA